MINYWLSLPTFGTFATLALLYYGLTLALFGLVFRSPLKARIATLSGVVPPFIATMAVLFSLQTSFLAYDVGERNRQASHAVQTEAGELQNVFALSVASVIDMRDIRAALKAYVNSILTDEWPSARSVASPRTVAAYDDLLRELSDPAVTRQASAAVHAAMLTAMVKAGTARSTRLSLTSNRTNDLKWVSVLILGAITLVALALVHLENRRAMMAALTVFATGAIVALGLIALQEDPFGGVFRVSQAPLERLLTLDYLPYSPAEPPPASPPTAVK
jgi:hypothetical protein